MWLDYLVVGVKCSWGKLTSGVNDSMIRWWLKCCPPEKGTSYGDFVVSMLVLGGVIDFVCFGWVLLTTGWQEELLQWQCELESPWILEFVFTKKQGIYIQCHENKLLLNLGSRVDIYIYGCFQKLWYPQIIHLYRVFHSKPSILGYPNFWKHPYIVFSRNKIHKQYELRLGRSKTFQGKF